MSAPRAAVNTLNLLAHAGRRDIPVVVGAHGPPCGTFSGGVPDGHGHNGVGNVKLADSGLLPTGEDAAPLLIRLAHQ